MNKISFDTGDVAASPTYDIGTFHMMVPDEKVIETMEALSMLGFAPRHQVTDE